MAARLTHGAATPGTLDLQLHEMSVIPEVPTTDHRTAGGTRLRYVWGVYSRRASLVFALRTVAEHDDFMTFYRTATAANTRLTFTADVTNFPGDTWSAFFTSEPTFERVRIGVGIMGWISVEIEDAPVTL